MKVVDDVITVTDATGASTSADIYSSNATSFEIRKSQAADRYLTNLKGIISVSFSIIIPNNIMQRGMDRQR